MNDKQHVGTLYISDNTINYLSILSKTHCISLNKS